MEKKGPIAVGLSGGLDSSVALARLRADGFPVLGLTAALWREGSRCCSLEDIVRAQNVCAQLGVPHVVAPAYEFFAARVVRPFVDEYARGRTPSPCVLCNQLVKFGWLLAEALRRGCTHLATGHYARVTRDENGVFHLRRGVDRAKDQSYFLHRLDQAQLAHVLFPLGDWTKEQARAYAAERDLPVPRHAESQDLCFLPADGQGPFLERYRPELARPGEIRDETGAVVGIHAGFHRFTIGQRAGLGVAGRERRYVTALDPETNTVNIGPRAAAECGGCRVEDIHWIAGCPPPSGTPLTVQLRYRHAGVGVTLCPRADGAADAHFAAPQFAVTPGQAAVFYAGDETLGGGWIVAKS